MRSHMTDSEMTVPQNCIREVRCRFETPLFHWFDLFTDCIKTLLNTGRHYFDFHLQLYHTYSHFLLL